MFKRKLAFAVIVFVLAVSLAYSSFNTSLYTFAAPKDAAFDTGDCVNEPETLSAVCCWDAIAPLPEPGESAFQRVCQRCSINLETGDFEECTEPVVQPIGLPTGDLPQLETVPPNRTLPGGGVGDVPTLEQVPPNRTLPGGGSGIPTLETSQVPDNETIGTVVPPSQPSPKVCVRGVCVSVPEPPVAPEPPPPNHVVKKAPLTGGGDLPTLEQVPPARTLPGDVSDLPTLQQQQGEPPLPVVCSEEAGLVKDPVTGQCVPIEQPPPSPPRGEDAEQPEEPEEQPDQDDQQSPENGDSSDGNNNGDDEGEN